MRLLFSTSCLVVFLTSATKAFVPVEKNSRCLTKTQLFAGRLPPPPPPPPPPQSGSTDLAREVLKRLQDATGQIKLPEVIFPDIKIPSPTLPPLDTSFLKVDAPSLIHMDQAQQTLRDLQPYLQENYPDALPLYQQFLSALSQVTESPYTPPAVILISTVIIQSLIDPFRGIKPSVPYPDKRYDAASAKAYFDQRPDLVIRRGLQVMTQSLGFAVTFLGDYIKEQNGEVIPQAQAEQRGRELAELLCQLGSTYIKVGQSLSIRTDILSPPYVRGLQTLQDQVPPFDSETAFQMMEEEWGTSIDEVVSEITPEPVASASLGQVYKATLKDSGISVAIKVQRPDIMENIALDMYLLREFIAPTVKRLGNLNSDTVGTVDAWGLGFVDELDYLAEARNARFFTEQIEQSPLKEVVFCPDVVNEYSTDRVLVTEWIDGERLDKSSQADVATLCSIAMNTYLTMLLEFGLLHCDPHPGNLLRTPDGQLCILDWGMVTRIDEDLQLALIEHVAHLTSADYEEVPRDLLLLGFIPQNKKDVIRDSGIVEVLAGIYGTWTSGGGVAAFNVNDVISQLQDLTAKKGNLFQIPPYFAYLAKSFAVLEGIGLSNNPKYSIINECLPYISQRLLTDSDSMQSALNTFIFGPQKNDEMRIVDYDRVEQLVTGFGNYTTSTSGALLGKGPLSRTQRLEQAADQILDLVFTEDETPLQDILLEQMAKIAASTSRTVFTELRERSGTLPSGRTILGTIVDPIGFWRTSPLVRPNDLDAKTVEMTRKLLSLVQYQVQNSNSDVDLSKLSREEVVEISSMLVRKVWAKRRGVFQTGNRFSRKLLELTAAKLERGERDTRRLPDHLNNSVLDRPFSASLTPQREKHNSPPELEDHSFNSELPVRSTPRVEIARQKQRGKSLQVSPRLQSARDRLEALKSGEDD